MNCKSSTTLRATVSLCLRTSPVEIGRSLLMFYSKSFSVHWTSTGIREGRRTVSARLLLGIARKSLLLSFVFCVTMRSNSTSSKFCNVSLRIGRWPRWPRFFFVLSGRARTRNAPLASNVLSVGCRTRS